MNEQKLMFQIEQMYNLAFTLMRNEEYRIKQNYIDELTLKPAINETATSINYEVATLKINSRRLEYDMKNLIELRKEIERLIFEE